MKKALIVLAILALPLGLAVRHVVIGARDAERLERLAAALEPELEEFSARTWPRTPLGEPGPGRAWDHYRAAEALRAEVEEAVWTDAFVEAEMRAEEGAIADADLPVLREGLARLEPYFDRIERGVRTTTSGFVLPPLLQFSPEMEEREFEPIRFAIRIQKVAVLSARVLARSGDPEAAVRRLRVLDSVWQDLCAGSSLIAHMVGVTIRESVFATLAELASSGLLPEDLRNRVEDRLRSDPAERPEGGVWLRSEALGIQCMFRALAAGEVDTEALRSLGSPPRSWWDRLFRSGPSRSEILEAWESFRALLEDVDAPEEYFRRLETVLKEEPDTVWGGVAGMLAAIAGPSARVDPRPARGACLVAFALLRHRSAAGELPALDALPEGVLPEPPPGDAWVLVPDAETGGTGITLRSRSGDGPLIVVR